MRKLSVNVPEELIDLAGGTEDSVSDLLTQSAVMELVRRRRISAGKAAELLGVSRWDLPDLFRAYQVPAATFSADDLRPL